MAIHSEISHCQRPRSRSQLDYATLTSCITIAASPVRKQAVLLGVAAVTADGQEVGVAQ